LVFHCIEMGNVLKILYEIWKKGLKKFWKLSTEITLEWLAVSVGCPSESPWNHELCTENCLSKINFIGQGIQHYWCSKLKWWGILYIIARTECEKTKTSLKFWKDWQKQVTGKKLESTDWCWSETEAILVPRPQKKSRKKRGKLLIISYIFHPTIFCVKLQHMILLNHKVIFYSQI
jgi:hypothetical protein